MDGHQVFLSYSHNDLAAATLLHEELKRQGLSCFWDKVSLREGDLWLDLLQQAVDGCGAFVLLVGRDGVGRWVGAETQAALNRYFGPRDDAERLPIFPILLDETKPETLPAFLRLFQATPWTGTDSPPPSLLERIRERKLPATEAIPLEGPPFVGLAAFRSDQAHLFFGRQGDARRARLLRHAARPRRSPLARDQRHVRLRQVVADAGGAVAADRPGLAVAAHRLGALAADRADAARPNAGQHAFGHARHRVRLGESRRSSIHRGGRRPGAGGLAVQSQAA